MSALVTDTILPRRLAPLAHRLHLYADREDWFADARNRAPEYRIGGTTAAAILGVGYRTPWDVYNEARAEVGRELDAGDDNAVLRRGRRWEPVAVAEYADATGRDVFTPLCRVVHPELPWLAPSPDAFVWDGRELGLGEVKTASSDEAWGEDGTVIEAWRPGSELLVPPGYAVQGYTTLAASDLPWLDFIVGTPDRVRFMRIRSIRLMADQATQNDILEALDTWRTRHLLRGEFPPVDGTDGCRHGLAKRFTGTGSKIVRAARPEEAELIVALADAQARKKSAEAEAAHLSNELQLYIGDDYGVQAGSRKALVVRSAGQSRLDSKALVADHPEIAAAYTRQGDPFAYVRLFGGKE